MNDMNASILNGAVDGKPWWSVRRPLVAALAVLTLILAAMLSPTPLNKWVFGEDFATALAER